MKNKLIVCGESWNTPSDIPKFRGTHYSELLAKDLNLQLLSFALSGCSNKAIAIQALDAIRQRPSLIIVGTCGHYGRIEIMGKDFPDLECEILGVKDFNYLPARHPLHPLGVRRREETTISSTVITRIEDYQKRDMYAMDHSTRLSYQIEVMCYFYMLKKLQQSGIPFLVYPAMKESFCFKEHEYNSWCDEKHIVKQSIYDHRELWVHDSPMESDPGYHTPPEAQVDVKNFLYNYITSNQIYMPI